jgi:amino acid transporter
LLSNQVKRYRIEVIIHLYEKYPGGNAVISLIFSEYLNRIIWHSTRAEVSPDDIPQWAIKLTAVGAVVVVTIICIAARKLGTQVAVVFTTVKVAISCQFMFIILIEDPRLPPL